MDVLYVLVQAFLGFPLPLTEIKLEKRERASGNERTEWDFFSFFFFFALITASAKDSYKRK